MIKMMKKKVGEANQDNYDDGDDDYDYEEDEDDDEDNHGLMMLVDQ